MAGNTHSPLGPQTPTDTGGEDRLRDLVRLLARAAARQWVAREHRSAPAAERQSEEKLDD
jgi:hypothetical protein